MIRTFAGHPAIAATAMATKIDAVEARDKLKPRTAPYWQKLSTGCHLGFRRMTSASAGTWLVQAYDDVTQKQTRRSLGSFDDMPKSRQYDAAKVAAEEWFKHLGMGGRTETQTVKGACAQYVKHVRARNAKTADDIAARFDRHVNQSRLAPIPLPKLKRLHLETWRAELAAKEVTIDPYADAPKTRKRAASSVNRDMTALRAALNHAHDHGDVTTDMAWRVALRPTENADGRRDAYLDRDQRKALIDAAQPDLVPFLRAMSLVPLRPGALAALTVGNFDKRLSVLTIGHDKAGGDRRIKLPDGTAKFFAALAKDKLPGAFLISQASGAAWNKDAWKKPTKGAALAAGLPQQVTAYSMRHSVITDLVTGGLDILTVALLSGTSVDMIEKHYGHLRADHAAAALAKLSL